MLYREFVPEVRLRPYVRLIWTCSLEEVGVGATNGGSDDDRGPELFAPPHRIAPDGLLEVIFHQRTPYRMRFAGEGFRPQPRSLAVSQTRRFVEIQPRGPSRFLSIRFHSWGARHFFRPPLSELADRQSSPEELWGREASELEERLAEAPDDERRVALAEGFLLRQLRRHEKAGQGGEIAGLVREIQRRRGAVRIGAWCRELGIGERRLQRLFAATLGMSPKSYARLSRFLHACQRLRAPAGSGGHRSLTEVGLDCGYYDQAHFIADFRDFCGMTPGQLAAAEDLSFLTLDA